KALEKHVTGEPMLSNFQRVLFPVIVEPTTFANYQVVDAKLDRSLVAEQTGEKKGDNNYMYRLARYAIRPEALAEWKEALHETIAEAKAKEPGTLMYLIMQETPEAGKDEEVVRLV